VPTKINKNSEKAENKDNSKNERQRNGNEHD